MDKKRIKIVFGIILSILIIGAGSFSGYVYWKKYGKRAEGSEGDYSKSKIVYLKEDRLRVLNENYGIEYEVRTVNKYTKFKIVNNNFIVLISEEGNIAVVDITKLNAIKVSDEQKKLEKSGHRHIFDMDNGIIGVLSDNGIYSEEKDESQKILGKEIVKAVKDSEMKFYKIDKNGKIGDALFEDIKPLSKSGKYISMNSKDYILYFNKENGNKIENIIEKSNIRNNFFSEVKDNMIKTYDVAGGKYPKKVSEIVLDKDSFAVAENGEIVQITQNESGVFFKQYEFDKEKKVLSVKSEVKGITKIDIIVLKVIDNKIFFTNSPYGDVELNFIDFEDIEAGEQNISSVNFMEIKYVAKRGENLYLFSEGASLFEIDLSKRKVESGKSSYEKKYKTKYIYSFIKSNKNEIYTVYSDNKSLDVKKNDFNKITDFIKMEGINVNSVDLYLKQVIDNSKGEKMGVWEEDMEQHDNWNKYRVVISKLSEKNKTTNLNEISQIKEFDAEGNNPISNIIYENGKIYYTLSEYVITAPASVAIENSEDQSGETVLESEAVTTESSISSRESKTVYFYVADENFNVIDKHEVYTLETEKSYLYKESYLLKDEDNIYIIGNLGLYIFNVSSKEMRKAEINLEENKETESTVGTIEYSLVKTKNKTFIFQNIIDDKIKKLYEIDKISGAKLNEYILDGSDITTIRTYEDKIVVADGKEIKVYSENLKPIDKMALKERVEFMEISGCRVYASGTYMPLAEINLETSEIMSEEYLPNLANADYIKLLFTE